MCDTHNRRPPMLQLAAFALLLAVGRPSAKGDIYQWEYIDPNEPSQGKWQSTTLAPDGAGVDAKPGANLSGLDLTKAYLEGVHLFGFELTCSLWPACFPQVLRANLTGTNLSDAELLNADLSLSFVAGANFDGAEIRGANFGYTDIALSQLYTTASYQTRDLAGLMLYGDNLTGGEFSQQNLANAAFSDASLIGASFAVANLTGAELDGADLTNADFLSANLTDADFTEAKVKGVDFRATEIAPEQLYSTASYQAHDLTGIRLGSDLNGWNFAGQTLHNVDFEASFLSGADFADADVRRANLSRHWDGFGFTIGTGITLSQLYSTASFQIHDLSGINLKWNDLAGGNFAGQNLANAILQVATLTGADFTAADLRGGIFSGYASGTTTSNMIWPDGHVNGLDVGTGELLVIRDYDGNPTRQDDHGAISPLPPLPISVDELFEMNAGGTLRLVFETDSWDSTVSFDPGIPVTLGGTLELTFAPDVNPASQLGRTFPVFDWTGVDPSGQFAISSPYQWDTSNLYTSGELTLIAVPEPCALCLGFSAFAVLQATCRGRRFIRF